MYVFFFQQKNMTPPIKKNLTDTVYKQIPTTQLAKMSIGPKFVELTADVLEIYEILKYKTKHIPYDLRPLELIPSQVNTRTTITSYPGCSCQKKLIFPPSP